MRLAKFRGSANPARANYKQDLRQNEIAQCQRLFEGDALLFNIAFCSIDFADHAPNFRACASLAHRKLACGAPAIQLPTINALAILSAPLVRCEIRGDGLFRPHMRCISQSPTQPLRAIPPRSRVERKISASATERRSQ